MRFEFPDLKRCCFCLPLRYGLIGWTYFKLIPLCLLILMMIDNIWKMIYSMKSQSTHVRAGDLALWTAMFLIQIGELIFSIIFLVGSHKKNVKLLRLYYYYSIVELAITVAIYTIVVGMVLAKIWIFMFHYYGFHFMMAYISVFIISFVICLYTILLTRSEIRKLENDCEVKFVNHAAEAECIMSICQDLGHDDNTAANDVTV